MKSLFALVVLLVSLNTFAGTKFICKENTESRWDSKKSMILTQLGHVKIKEGVVYDFKLEIYDTNSSHKPFVSEIVSVETEDVMFGFSNKIKKIEGMIYLDELDQTWVKVGKTEMSFNCN